MAIKVGYTLETDLSRIATQHSLSDKAFRIYCYLVSRHDGQDLDDHTIASVFDVGLRSVRRYKKELIESGYILIDSVKTGERMWVGAPAISAERIKEHILS